MRSFVARRWFLFCLAVVLILGMGWASELASFVKFFPRRAVVAMVLFAMSVTLDAASIGRALVSLKAVVLAVAINLGLLPLVAWAVSTQLATGPATGLLVAAAIPSTLASAAVWTRRAGGNDAVALLVMMVTNLSCFVVTPAWLFATTGRQIAQLNATPAEMVANLALVVVLPILLGQFARLNRAVGAFATRRKILLGVLAQCGILSMVLLGAIRSGQDLQSADASARLSALDWLGMLVSVSGVHLSMLWAGHALGRVIGIGREERIAVGFAGSQKTLMVGLELAVTYFPAAPILPVVCYHVCQLLLDTIVADKLRKQ